MFCSNCGKPIQGEQSFCASCGFRLKNQLAPPVAQLISQPVHSSQMDAGARSANAPKPMKFIESVKYSYKNYAKFKGRASRSEYWYWQLYILIGPYGSALCVAFWVGLLQGIFGGDGALAGSLGVVAWYLFTLSATIPTLARGVRRLHDIGKSGWNLFFLFVPLVGGILLLVWTCRDGGPDNEYGPSFSK